MKTRSVVTLIFAVAIAAAGTVWIKSLVPPDSPTGSLQFLSAAPELPIFARDGKKIDLTKEKDRVLIVHFWATWCPPCVEETPALSRYWEHDQGPRRHLPLRDLGRQGLEDRRRLPEEEPELDSPLPRPGPATAKRFGSSQYPETYVVNPKGRVLFRVQGPVDWANPEVRTRIEQLIAS